MKRISKIAVLFIVILLLSMGSVYALGFNFSARPSATTVEPGDSITIDLSISNIDAGELGINTIEAFLEYDKDVFEIVESSNFAGLNNWSITYNSETGENEGKFVAVILQDGVTEDQNIGRITLKVKEQVSEQTTQVVLRDIKTNDGTTEIPTSNQTININIDNPEPVIEEPEPQPEPEPETPTTSPDPIPQTGETTYIILGACGVAIVVSVILFSMYRKMRDIK